MPYVLIFVLSFLSFSLSFSPSFMFVCSSVAWGWPGLMRLGWWSEMKGVREQARTRSCAHLHGDVHRSSHLRKHVALDWGRGTEEGLLPSKLTQLKPRSFGPTIVACKFPDIKRSGRARACTRLFDGESLPGESRSKKGHRSGSAFLRASTLPNASEKGSGETRRSSD